MNYSSISDAYNNNNDNNNDIYIDYILDETSKIDVNNDNNLINSAKLLNDYKKIKKILENNKILLDNLNKRNDILAIYSSNIYISHIDIMLNFNNDTFNNDTNEMNNDTNEMNNNTNEMNNNIIKYNELFIEYYNNWVLTYYNLMKKKLIDNIDKYEKKLFGYRQLFINTTNEIINSDKQNKNLCPICFENEINMCAIPCGHTCCSTCIFKNLKYDNGKCLNCRNNLTEYIRLYIQI